MPPCTPLLRYGPRRPVPAWVARMFDFRRVPTHGPEPAVRLARRVPTFPFVPPVLNPNEPNYRHSSRPGIVGGAAIIFPVSLPMATVDGSVSE